MSPPIRRACRGCRRRSLSSPSASGGFEDAAGGAGKGKRLQGHVPGAGHVDEEEPFASEQALGDAALHLHLVVDGRLDHHHAAGVDRQQLAGGEVEVEKVAAAVEPDGALALQALQEEALAAALDPHPELLREGALDLDLAVVAEVGVLLADDLAVELVLADRAGEGPGEPDRPGAVRPVLGEEQALARENLPLQPARDAARDLDGHRDVAREEHHRARLRGQQLARLERDHDRWSVPFADRRFHVSDASPLGSGVPRRFVAAYW